MVFPKQEQNHTDFLVLMAWWNHTESIPELRGENATAATIVGGLPPAKIARRQVYSFPKPLPIHIIGGGFAFTCFLLSNKYLILLYCILRSI